MEKKCLQCKMPFIPKRKEQQYCTRSCASVKKGQNSSAYMEGKRNAWKGGRRIDTEGYIRVYDSVTRDYKREHRIIARADIGEIVHHINGDITDNRPENLELTTFTEHSRLHAMQREMPKHGKDGRFIA